MIIINYVNENMLVNCCFCFELWNSILTLGAPEFFIPTSPKQRQLTQRGITIAINSNVGQYNVCVIVRVLGLVRVHVHDSVRVRDCVRDHVRVHVSAVSVSLTVPVFVYLSVSVSVFSVTVFVTVSVSLYVVMSVTVT